MGVKLIRASGRITKGIAAEDTIAMPAQAAFVHAATVTALNPKSIAFLIVVVPQFLTPDAPLIPQFAALIATFVTMAALNALSYARIADRMGPRLREPAALIWLNRTGGAALIGMGPVTALMRRA
jgi:threonine/homoserine/homoserine lactone efflux protein